MVHGSFRRALLARFPYAVYFVVTARGVWIVAVQHLARDPRSVWRRAP
ncbi:MAG: hypothetical protein K8S98_13505 [Planctomycetes bacterium]|nr:hypothetical protein [Planctomycetota bacterium]